MERGVREKREMIERLEQVRAVVRSEDMAPDLRAGFEYAIAELERDILVPVATDTGPVLAALAAWGPRLEAAHPVLAEVLARVVAELRAAGLQGGGHRPA